MVESKSDDAVERHDIWGNKTPAAVIMDRLSIMHDLLNSMDARMATLLTRTNYLEEPVRGTVMQRKEDTDAQV